MKKLLVIFMVLAFVAPAMAADNLSLKGEMKVRMWDIENYGDYDDAGSDKVEFVDQRLRIQGAIKASDMAKVVFRVDLAEMMWGDTADGNARPGPGTNEQLQVDRAYLDVKKGIVNVKAGYMFHTLGQGVVLRDNSTGAAISIKTPVLIKLGYWVRNDSDDPLGPSGWGGAHGGNGTVDEHGYYLSLKYKTKAVTAEAFYGTQEESTAGAGPGGGDQENNRTVMGVYGAGAVGPVKLRGEAAFFGGDTGTATPTDYTGTQVNVSAAFKMSDMVTLGADVVYSDGTKKTDEVKITAIGDRFGRREFATGGDRRDITAGDFRPISGDGIFDPFSDDLGALGIGVHGVVKPVGGLTVYAQILYLTAAEDIGPTDAEYSADDYDSALVYNLGVDYVLAPKATLSLLYNMVDKDNVGATASDDNASAIFGQLKVNF